MDRDRELCTKAAGRCVNVQPRCHLHAEPIQPKFLKGFSTVIQATPVILADCCCD